MMTWFLSRYPRARRAIATAELVACGVGALATSGCGLLDVSDPTRVEASEINNAASADLLRRKAVGIVPFAVSLSALSSGLLSDEFFADPLFSVIASGALTPDMALDRRESERYEQVVPSYDNPYTRWHEIRRAASVALPIVRANMLEPVRSAYIGQLLGLRGYATLKLAEDYCPGFPLNDVVDGQIARTGPQTTTEAFERALTDLDSAVVYAADSARFLNFARIAKGRALLGLGRFAEAGVAVAAVPDDYTMTAEYSVSVTYQPNRLWLYYNEFSDLNSVANREGGTGLDFVAAHDPRVPTTPLGPTHDDTDTLYSNDIYPDEGTPVVMASGTEARLIEAEAALHDGGNWLAILNALRTRPGGPGLVDTTAPTDPAAQVDLLFRERAFWLFGTGHRLGDLRRLIAHYGRAPESVLPTGLYRHGEEYNSATSLAFPSALEHADNPAITGCTSR